MECLAKQRKHINTFSQDIKSLLNENLYRLLMTPPMIFIFAFTILPLIFMICMAFTSYSKIDNHLMLFDWVGLENFRTLIAERNEELLDTIDNECKHFATVRDLL